MLTQSLANLTADELDEEFIKWARCTFKLPDILYMLVYFYCPAEQRKTATICSSGKSNIARSERAYNIIYSEFWPRAVIVLDELNYMRCTPPTSSTMATNIIMAVRSFQHFEVDLDTHPTRNTVFSHSASTFELATNDAFRRRHAPRMSNDFSNVVRHASGVFFL